jgi:DNA-directed RNA polymerase specialized sigma24 family protein
LRRRRELPLEGHALSCLSEDAGSGATDQRFTDVQAALARLPELHRSALTLRYFEKMDYAAIEQLLGISNGALRGILGRALQTLRKNLRPALTEMRST